MTVPIGYKPPTIEEIDEIARCAFETFPEKFRALCGDVIIHVADFAEEEILDDLRIDDPFELTGLYEGTDLINRSADDIPAGPSHVHLYRKPILAEWIDDGEMSLETLIRHILVHEIGHHFGLSDEDMERIEASG